MIFRFSSAQARQSKLESAAAGERVTGITKHRCGLYYSTLSPDSHSSLTFHIASQAWIRMDDHTLDDFTLTKDTLTMCMREDLDSPRVCEEKYYGAERKRSQHVTFYLLFIMWYAP